MLQLEKETALRKEINTIEKQLQNSNKDASGASGSTEEDSLDHYMKELKQMKLDKQAVIKLKSDLSKLKQDLANVAKLVNITKPTALPTLIKETQKTTLNDKLKNKLPIFGKRLKVKVQLPERKDSTKIQVDDNEEEEEEDQEEKVEAVSKPITVCTQNAADLSVTPKAIKNETFPKHKIRKNETNQDEKLENEFSKIDASFKMIFPLMSTVSERHLRNIWSKMKSLHPAYLESTQEDILNSFLNYTNSSKFIAVIDAFTNEIDSISDALKAIQTGDDILQTAQKLIKLAKEITLAVNKLGQDDDEPDESDDKNAIDEGSSELDTEKKKKKNQRRLQHRQEKAEIEKQKGYQEDAAKEDYNMWVPPAGQTGDGRTSLNEKYGY